MFCRTKAWIRSQGLIDLALQDHHCNLVGKNLLIACEISDFALFYSTYPIVFKNYADEVNFRPRRSQLRPRILLLTNLSRINHNFLQLICFSSQRPDMFLTCAGYDFD